MQNCMKAKLKEKLKKKSKNIIKIKHYDNKHLQKTRSTTSVTRHRYLMTNQQDDTLLTSACITNLWCTLHHFRLVL